MFFPKYFLLVCLAIVLVVASDSETDSNLQQLDEESKPKSFDEEPILPEIEKWQRVNDDDEETNLDQEPGKSKPLSFEEVVVASGRSLSSKKSKNRHPGLDFSNVNCKGDFKYPPNRPSSPVISVFNGLKVI